MWFVTTISYFPVGGSTSSACRGGVLSWYCHTQFLCQNQVLIVCMTQD
jgi:hypothetical protein